MFIDVFLLSDLCKFDNRANMLMRKIRTWEFKRFYSMLSRQGNLKHRSTNHPQTIPDFESSQLKTEI